MINQYTILTDPEKINRKDWSEFVLKHPAGNIFQTPEYFDLCRSTPLFDGISVCCTYNGRISGILVARVIRDFRGAAGFLTARSVIMGGPLAKDDDPEIAAVLLEAYINKVRKNILFSQVRNLSETGHIKNSLISAGFKFEDHLDILINISGTPESILSGMHPTRRKQISRSIKREVVVSADEMIDDVTFNTCMDLLKNTYRRAGMPLPGPEFFRNAIRVFSGGNRLKIFLARFNNEIIGFRMVLCYGRKIYDWYAAASEKHLDKYPNDILPWEVMKWGNENGYEVFDFGGAGRPDKPYGVRDFKQKFGGQTVNFGRFTRIHRPVLYQVVMKAFGLRRLLIKVTGNR